MRDPTREELEAIVWDGQEPEFRDPDIAFDAEQAIYWFAADYHSGQWSNLYSVLSTSEYGPGMCETGVGQGTIAEEMYQALVEEFGQ
jgi:hypothetical protein